MNEIRKRHEEEYGYRPTDIEILSMYLSGELMLSDKEENDLQKHFNIS
jgi:hypothetical protein